MRLSFEVRKPKSNVNTRFIELNGFIELNIILKFGNIADTCSMSFL